MSNELNRLTDHLVGGFVGCRPSRRSGWHCRQSCWLRVRCWRGSWVRPSWTGRVCRVSWAAWGKPTRAWTSATRASPASTRYQAGVRVKVVLGTTHRNFFLTGIFCPAAESAEEQHGGGEPSPNGAEPDSAEGEPGLIGAESGPLWPALLPAEGVPVSTRTHTHTRVCARIIKIPTRVDIWVWFHRPVAFINHHPKWVIAR